MDDFLARRARSAIFNLKEYVPGKPIEEVRRELGLSDIIKMASNENPLGPSKLAMNAVVNHLGGMHIYPDKSYRELKEKLASVLKVDPSQILVGNGSDEILKMIAECFLNPGDEVIQAQPTFSEYAFTAILMGAVVNRIPLLDYTHDLKGMLAAVNQRTKIVYICNPNNPTGTIVTRKQLDAFMDQVPDDVLVVFDEAYREYVESSQFCSGLEYLKQGRHVIVLRTFSKLYGLAALRLGYGITSAEIARGIDRVTEPFNVNLVAQWAGMAALDDYEHVELSLATNARGKEYLYQSLDNLRIDYVPTQANFVFIDTGHDARAVFDQLLRHGIIVRTGDVFGYPTFIRLTVGTAQQNRRFISALKTVLEGM